MGSSRSSGTRLVRIRSNDTSPRTLGITGGFATRQTMASNATSSWELSFDCGNTGLRPRSWRSATTRPTSSLAKSLPARQPGDINISPAAIYNALGPGLYSPTGIRAAQGISWAAPLCGDQASPTISPKYSSMASCARCASHQFKASHRVIGMMLSPSDRWLPSPSA